MTMPLRVALVLAVVPLTGCVGQAIETTTDAVIAVGKVPFKVGGAVVDVVAGDDDKEKDDDK